MRRQVVTAPVDWNHKFFTGMKIIEVDSLLSKQVTFANFQLMQLIYRSIAQGD